MALPHSLPQSLVESLVEPLTRLVTGLPVSAGDLFGAASVLVALLAGIPQLVRIARERTVAGVSLPALANAAVTSVAWTAYSGWLRDGWLLAASAVAVPGALATVALAWRCRPRLADLALPAFWAGLLAGTAVAEAFGLRVLGMPVLAPVLGASIAWLVVPGAVEAWRSRDVSGIAAGSWWFLVVEGLVAIGYGLCAGVTAPLVFGVVEIAGSAAVLLRLAVRGRCPAATVPAWTRCCSGSRSAWQPGSAPDRCWSW